MIEGSSFLTLLQNIAFLLSLVLIFDLLRLKVSEKNVFAKKILIGILIGGMGILIMLTPWVLSPGIVFDTRSVLLSITGLFFGAIPALVAMAITAALRIYQGGGGALTGVLVILATGSLGVAWHYLHKQPLIKVKWWQLYLYGVLVHFVMLALMFTLPKESVQPVLTSISLPVLIIYPIGTLLLGLVLRNRLRRDAIQEELISATNRLNKTQQLSKIGGWDYDTESETVFWTDEVYHIHGFSPSEIPPGSTEHLEKSLLCYPPEDRKVIEKAFQDCIKNGNPYDLILRFTTVTGENKWVRTSAEAFFDGGKVTKINGTIMDITEKKKAEDEFLEINADFRTLIELAPVGIVIYDNDGRNYFINRKFSEITGYKQEDIPILSDWWLKAYPDLNYRNQVMEQWDTAVELAKATDSSIVPMETRIRKKDGDYCYLEIGYVSSVEKNIATFVDITKRKVAELDLLESEKRYRTLLNSAPIGIVVFTDNRIDYINPAGLQIMGANPDDDLVGKPIIEFIHPKMLEITRNNFQELSNDENLVVNFENIFLKLDRSPVYVETIGTSILFGGKNAIQVIVTDISERKAAEEQSRQHQETLQELLETAERSRQSLLSLIEDQREAEEKIRKLNEELELRVQERTAQLEASNKELEAFAYSISHDLRAPLRGIDGFSRILEQEYAPTLDEEGKRIVNIICKSTSKMDQLIVDILALSRVSRQDLIFSMVDMQTMANSIYHEVASPDEKQKIELDIADLPEVQADPTLMRLVWTNLISNAIKYTKPKNDWKIWINGFEEDGFCTYSIQDNGVGYDSRYVDKLFGLFQRLHNERDFEGTGVGLAIVQRIIHRHNGKVWSESILGEGATFYFSIPKRQINYE
jgi:PAS domain S-box-containing protein